MAETSIGKGNLTLGVNSGALGKGLKAATSTLSGWASSTAGMMKSKSAGIMSAFGMGGSVKGGLLGLAGGMGLGAFDGAIDKVRELSQVGKQAKNLGIESGQFMGLAEVFKKSGVEGNEMIAMLAKMQAKVSDAANGNAQMAGTFKSIGLNAQDLAAMKPDEQFKAIADAIGGLKSKGDQTAVAMKLFEEQGVKLGGVWSQGSAGIQKQIEKAKELGTALGQTDMDKLMKAQSAIPKLGKLWDGFKNKTIVAIAPIIELIGGKLSSVVEGITPLFSWVSRGISTHWGIIADVIGEGVSLVWDFGKSVIGAIGEVFSFGGEMMSIEDIVTGAWKAIGIAAAYVWDVIKAGAGGVSFAMGTLVNVFADVSDAYTSFLEKFKGSAVADMIPGFDKMVENSKKGNAILRKSGDEMKAWGKGTFDNFGKSADSVKAWFEKRKNKGGEDMEDLGDEFGKGLEPAMKKAAKEVNFAGAFEKGSKEEYSILLDRGLNAQLSAQQKSAEALLAIKNLNEQSRKALQKIVDYLKDKPGLLPT